MRPGPAFTEEQESHDFFISHASEDKDEFVRALATALRTKGANVWYDEFALKVGDSLRRNIDRGLAGARFGVVVLSAHFFAKEWPNKELDGLFAREVQGESRILPIWHKVSKDEVARYSPMVADKVALNTSLKSVDEIVAELVRLQLERIVAKDDASLLRGPSEFLRHLPKGFGAFGLKLFLA